MRTIELDNAECRVEVNTETGEFFTTGRIMFIKEDLMNTRASSSFRNLAGLQNPVYSEDLELHYQFHRNRGVLEFEDGVEYTVRESLIISKGRPKPEELKKLHEIKKIFNGEFLTKEDLQERELFYGADQRPVTRAGEN